MSKWRNTSEKPAEPPPKAGAPAPAKADPPRPEPDQCGNCKFFRDGKIAEDPTVGTCHEGPPDAAFKRATKVGPLTHFRVVEYSDWCGRHRRRENS